MNTQNVKESSQLNVLVTGGYGFIGSTIARKFFELGSNIFIIDNLSTGQTNNISFKHNFYQYSIDDAQCENVFQTNKIDIVIHCAAQTNVQVSMGHPLKDSHANIYGLFKNLDTSKKVQCKTFCLYFLSSCLWQSRKNSN